MKYLSLEILWKLLRPIKNHTIKEKFIKKFSEDELFVTSLVGIFFFCLVILDIEKEQLATVLFFTFPTFIFSCFFYSCALVGCRCGNK